MHTQKRTMLWVNVLGGTAVLASYAHGFLTHPQTSGALWGGVPDWLRPLYTLSMLLAAAGYLLFTWFLHFRVDPGQVRIAGRFGFGCINALYALVLIPSALWMPLTFLVIDGWTGTLWFAIRAVLAMVGLGSLGMLAALLTLTPRRPKMPYCLAVVGALAFCVQTAVLDACVWPAFFPLPR
ncbi:MAG: hypothetical protein H6Q33_3306 [Deltaproteobacteria bacterium]|jgi:hypothetical protein|nr:hypothetical protein [Deltaproteobacteria bacterium]